MKNGKKNGKMLNSEMYNALRAAGIPEEHAQRVAAESAKTDICYHALDQLFSSLQEDIKALIATDRLLMTWVITNLGVLLTSVIGGGNCHDNLLNA